MRNTTPIKAAIVTISDTRKRDNDTSGERLAELLAGIGAELVDISIVTDDPDSISAKLSGLSQMPGVELVLTTGGTGLGPRDNTPEATRAVIEREAPGIAEAMRRETAGKTPMAMLSRGVAGTAGRTLIINLPGSPKAVEECFEVVRPVLRHAVDLLRGETAHRSEEDRDGN